MNADESNALVRLFARDGYWTRVLPDLVYGEILVVLDGGTRRITQTFCDQGHARCFLMAQGF